MDNETKVNTPPRRGMGRRGNPGEKPKNFKQAITRLFSELRSFKTLIVIALILAALGSVLSILAPNRLSELTDSISGGLVVNSANMEELSTKITDSLNKENISNKMQDILAIDLSQEKIAEVMQSQEISNEDKQEFQAIMMKIGQSEENETMSFILEIPDSVLNFIIPTTIYKDVQITTIDKKELLNMASSKVEGMDTETFKNMPDSIKKVLFEDIEIDGNIISSIDQVRFLELMSTLSEDNEPGEIYSKIDEMPETIQAIVKPYMDMDKVKSVALFLVGLYVCSAIFTLIESISMTDVSNKFAKRLRSNISDKINKLPLKYFDRHQSGDILSRVTNDVDTIAQSMNQSLATLVSSVTLFVGTIIMMFYTNWIMAITAICASLIGFVLMAKILGKSQKYFIARQVELGNLNGHIEEIYSGLNVVKVYNGKKEADEKFDELNNRVYECNRKSQFLSGLMQPLMGFIGNFGYVAVCIVGALLTMNDVISFGVIVAFITYVRLFTSPLSQMAQAMTSLQSTAAASERVFEFLDEEELEDESDKKAKLDKSNVKGNIEFKNVVFQYDNNDKPTIKNFSAKAKAGQKIAIVGPTGAGKTTLVNLLMKFYEINSGDILIDGVSIHDLTRENIHDLFVMVLQDTWLFDGTVRDNIIYNKENISDEEVLEACKKVGLEHFIKTLPNGLDTELLDTDSISAGQKQLLTIARGLIEKAPFLILDEATSNVDTRTEEVVQKAMDKLTEGRTSFIIAHRLSTIKNADLILVIKEGNIIEQGSHNELIEQNGFYADLYNSQFSSCVD